MEASTSWTMSSNKSVMTTSSTTIRNKNTNILAVSSAATITTTTTTTTTAKRRRRLPFHKQQTQQILQQMKGTLDTQQALKLLQLPRNRRRQSTTTLQQFTETSCIMDDENVTDTEDDDYDDEDDFDDQIFVDALHLCSKARRYDVALAIYPHLCSTEACRQMAIYACGKCGQDQLVLDLLTFTPPPPSPTARKTSKPPTSDTAAAGAITAESSAANDAASTSLIAARAAVANYNTALTVLPWERAYQLLINDMTKIPPRPNEDKDQQDEDNSSSVLDILSCNIVLHAMAKARRGDEALELWKCMTTPTSTASPPPPPSQQNHHHHNRQPQCKSRLFPTPDRSSWHHVMTACLNSIHHPHHKGSANQQQQLLQQQQQQQRARAVYYELFLPHVAASQYRVHSQRDSSASVSTDNGHAVAFFPNDHTYDTLSRAFAKMGDWEMVRAVEEHQKCQEHLTATALKPTRESLPTEVQQPPSSGIPKRVNIVSTSSDQKDPDVVADTSSSSMPQQRPQPEIPSINADLEQQYYYFEHWTGMTKVGRGKTAYWILGSYNDATHENTTDDEESSSSKPSSSSRQQWRVALQPHRNPSKNGIKLIFLIASTATEHQEHDMTRLSDQHQQQRQDSGIDSSVDGITWKKVGHVLMINSRNDQHFEMAASTTGIGARPTSMLLGLFIDPLYRKQSLSKRFLAIWLHCCRWAGLQPQTGVIRKPLLALVLEHTFGFVPTMVVSNASNRDGATVTTTMQQQGVEVEIFFPPPAHPDSAANNAESTTINNDADDTIQEEPQTNVSLNGNNLSEHSNAPDSTSKVHLYSPFGKGLKGTFSPWDLTREGIVIESHPPPPGSRGRRLIHLMCNFVLSLEDARMEARIDNILGTSNGEPNVNNNCSSSSLVLVLSGQELQDVFLGK